MVVRKLSGWEVYGGHNQLQLVEVVKELYGQRKLFADASHNHGFLSLDTVRSQLAGRGIDLMSPAVA